MGNPPRRRIGPARAGVGIQTHWIFEDRVLLSGLGPLRLPLLPMAVDLISTLDPGTTAPTSSVETSPFRASDHHHTTSEAIVSDLFSLAAPFFPGPEPEPSVVVPVAEALGQLDEGGANTWLWPEPPAPADLGGSIAAILAPVVNEELPLLEQLAVQLPGLVELDARIGAPGSGEPALSLSIDASLANLELGVETKLDPVASLIRIVELEGPKDAPHILDLGISVDSPLLVADAGAAIGLGGPGYLAQLPSAVIDLGLSVESVQTPIVAIDTTVDLGHGSATSPTGPPISPIDLDLGLSVEVGGAPILVVDAAVEAGGPAGSPGQSPTLPGLDLGLSVDLGETPILVVDTTIGRDIPTSPPTYPMPDLPGSDPLPVPGPIGPWPGLPGTPEEPARTDQETTPPPREPEDLGAASPPNSTTSPGTVGPEADPLPAGPSALPGRGDPAPLPLWGTGARAGFPMPSAAFDDLEGSGGPSPAIAPTGRPGPATGHAPGWTFSDLAALVATGPTSVSFDLANLVVSAFGVGQSLDVLALVAPGHGTDDQATTDGFPGANGPAILASASAVLSAWPEMLTVPASAIDTVLQFAHDRLAETLDSIDRLIDELFDRSEGISLVETLTAIGLTAYAAGRLIRLRQGETRGLAADGVPFHRHGPGPFRRGPDDRF